MDKRNNEQKLSQSAFSLVHEQEQEEVERQQDVLKGDLNRNQLPQKNLNSIQSSIQKRVMKALTQTTSHFKIRI